MAQFTTHYALLIPQVTDNLIGSTLPNMGSSNTIIDTTMYSLQTQITNNYTTLDTKIDLNYTTLDSKIDYNDLTINNRVDNIILNSAPLPSVAAQEVMDARYSLPYNHTYAVLTDRINHAEQKIIDTQTYVNTTVNNALISMQAQIDGLKQLIYLGGIG